MRKFPEPISTLMGEFMRLPGVGPKTALRYVYALLKLGPDALPLFAKAIAHLADIRLCQRCFMHTENTLCSLCSDPSRDARMLCVVTESRDIATIESTGNYRGHYHVLGGTLDPVEGITSEHLRIRELVERIMTDQNIREIIFAISPDLQGEMTMSQLFQALKPFERRVTRLARGLPTGADLEFADEVTLGDAITGRREM